MQRSVPAPMSKPQTVSWNDQAPQPSSHNGFARQLIPVSTLHNTRVLHDKVTRCLHRYVERLLAHTPCHSHAPAQTCTSKRSLMQSLTGCSQNVKVNPYLHKSYTTEGAHRAAHFRHPWCAAATVQFNVQLPQTFLTSQLSITSPTQARHLRPPYPRHAAEKNKNQHCLAIRSRQPKP